MKVALAGPVTSEHLDSARLFGIEPTAFVTAGRAPKTSLPIDRVTECQMLGDDGLRRKNLNSKLCVFADALVAVGPVDEHLLEVAQRFGLLVYRV